MARRHTPFPFALNIVAIMTQAPNKLYSIVEPYL